MKEFIIKDLTLKNFKGQNRVFKPNKSVTKVFGENGIGKTTLYKGFAWLLTGYTDALNTKNHELYDNRIEITHETPETSVKATILLDDIEYTIERKAKSKFSRRRGSLIWEKDSSDSYTLLIDDIETSVKDFTSWLERNICDAEILVYMIIGERFANLTIDDRAKARKILEYITGSISIDEMKGDYSAIKNDLMKYPIEELEERYKNKLKPLKKRIDTIVSLIDLKEDEYAEFDIREYKSLEKQIKEKNKELSEIDEQILCSSDGIKAVAKERMDIFKKIQDLETELSLKKYNFQKKQEEELDSLKLNLNEIIAKNNRIKFENEQKEKTYQMNIVHLDSYKSKLKSHILEREELVNQREEVKRRVFHDTTCSYCGQILPVEMIDDLKRKFSEEKRKELSRIVERGKFVKQLIDDTSAKIKELEEVIEKEFEPTSYIGTNDLEEQIKNFCFKDFKNTDEYTECTSKIEELKNSMPHIEQNNEKLEKAKKLLLEEIQTLNRQYGRKIIMDKIFEEITSLKKERVSLGCEISFFEGCLEKCKEYIEERASIISDRINSKLDDCKIIMYSRQKDGELKPDCIIVNNDGVKYSTMNNSARIKICLSLQRMFCKHYDMNMPIFIDEASVFDSKNLPKFDAQTVLLFASDDKTLKVE